MVSCIRFGHRQVIHTLLQRRHTSQKDDIGLTRQRVHKRVSSNTEDDLFSTQFRPLSGNLLWFDTKTSSLPTDKDLLDEPKPLFGPWDTNLLAGDPCFPLAPALNSRFLY